MEQFGKETINQKIGGNFDKLYELDRCANWIKRHQLEKVCLQFPDKLMCDSTRVALKLKERIGTLPYILGDTAYGSCCVDDVAAKHVNADGIIHFGHACLTARNSNVRALFVFEKQQVDSVAVESQIRLQFKDMSEKILLLYDVCYHHSIERVVNNIKHDYGNLVVSELVIPCGKVSETKEEVILARKFKLAEDTTIEDYTVIFIGNDGPTLSNFVLEFSGKSLYWYDPEGKKQLHLYEFKKQKFLMKQMYRIEHIKDAKTWGIVVGTMGVSNSLAIVDRIKELGALQGKKCYIIAIGKPNISKLANFPEIDVFVLVACLENSLLQSEELNKVIVTPYEVELACNANRQWSFINIIDFQRLLPGGSHYQEFNKFKSSEEDTSDDVSLVTGQVRVHMNLQSELQNSNLNPSSELAVRDDLTVSTVLATGSAFFQERSWQGLEQNLDQDEAVLAVEGRAGIPQSYNTDFNAMNDQT